AHYTPSLHDALPISVPSSIFLLFNFFTFALYGQAENSLTGNISPVEEKSSDIVELIAIDLEIGQFMKQWGLPGASVALVKDGKWLYAKAFGKADINIPTQTEHAFRIASLSKLITAIAV